MPGTVHDEEELRHCLTVVAGYIGLVLEDRESGLDTQHWLWVQRARDAAMQGLAVFERGGSPAV